MASIGVNINLETVFVAGSEAENNPFRGVKCNYRPVLPAQHLCFTHAVQVAAGNTRVHIITDDVEDLQMHCDVCLSDPELDMRTK